MLVIEARDMAIIHHGKFERPLNCLMCFGYLAVKSIYPGQGLGWEWRFLRKNVICVYLLTFTQSPLDVVLNGLFLAFFVFYEIIITSICVDVRDFELAPSSFPAKV